ncbi:antibiotic biosynthesis monooxygenase [Desulfobacterales bacterium HSG2]|nr:antibiotic biosynthesis monooxygenase [Desulfobacterales bacterium HSG2]
MAVKIFIKRKVTGSSTELTELLMELRTLTMAREGYISGETLKRVDKPEEVLVISTWKSIDDWKDWVSSKERTTIQDKIDLLLGKKTKYAIYQN